MSTNRKLTDENRPRITVPSMIASLDVDSDRFDNGQLRFTLEDCVTKVKLRGKEIGFVAGAFGGGVVISSGTRVWYLSAKNIWDAVTTAEQKEYIKPASKRRRK